jgi:HD superfamily phosphohydrolase
MSAQKRIGDIGLYYDPLYGQIPISPVFRRALNLKTVQRLRRLKQLATLDLAFPGATHTRFAHSVGVFHLAGIMFDTLFDIYSEALTMGKPLDWPPLNAYHKLTVQLAALLHDVGHGPFSHIFELFCKRHAAYRTMEHEYISERLITTGMGEYNDIPNFLHSLIEREKERKIADTELNFLKPNNIAKMVQGIAPPADPRYLFLSQIVKWPLDADRMDYLRRDSLYTGVETGRVDIWEIINNLRIHKEKLPDGKDVYTLKVNRSAAIAVEAFLIARDFTYRRLYFNEIHRANQEMIIRGFFEIAKSYSSPEDMVLKTDDEILAEFEKGSPFTRKVARRLLSRDTYETLPMKLRVHEDMPAGAIQKWEDLLKLDRTKVFDTEKRLAQDIGIPNEDTVIFDIEKSPLAKKEDFHEKIILDEDIGKPISLVEALPHLALTRGEFILPFYKEPIDLSTVYINMLSLFSIFVPASFLSDRVNEYKETCLKSGKLLNSELIFKVFEEKFPSSPFLRIFDEFMSLLGISGQDKERLLSRYKEALYSYVSSKLLESQK